MIKISTVVELDLSCTAPRARINAKQGDGGTRQIVARFTNGSGVISDLSTVTSAELKVLRPDGVTVKAAAALADGSATATLTAEMLAVAGRAFGDMVLYGDEESISAARFDVNIMAAADSGIAPDPTPEPQDSGKPALASAVAEGCVGVVGNAIRPNVSFDITNFAWEQGYYDYSNGSAQSGSNDIRTPDTQTNSDICANIIGGSQMAVKAKTTSGADMSCRVLFYNTDGSFLSSTGSYLIPYGDSITIPTGAASMRIGLGGVGAITPSDLAECALIFYKEV